MRDRPCRLRHSAVRRRRQLAIWGTAQMLGEPQTLDVDRVLIIYEVDNVGLAKTI